MKYWLAGLILITCIIIPRLYKISAPVADWHSWRQADTAAVARNFIKFGFNPLKPRYDDLSNIPSGKDNPMGWRMVEFPIYQSVAFLFKKVLPLLTIEICLRVVSILSLCISAVVLFLLVQQTLGYTVGLIAGLVFALLPYSIYYGRTILPEPFMLMWVLLSTFFMFLFTPNAQKKRTPLIWLFISAVCAACALLVKPTAAFLLIPNGYLLIKQYKLSWRWAGIVVGYAVIMFFPLWWWRTWINQFPEGVPAYDWLLNGGDIRFKGAWFYWLFAERIAKLILGYWGVVPFVLGLLLKPDKKEGWIFRWLGIGSLLYLIVFARGNVQHDYYQILLLPVISIYVAKGFVALIRFIPAEIVVRFLAILGISLFSWGFSWYTIRTYYWINRPEIVEAGKAADLLLPKDAKVIAPYNGDTAFLYQTNRQGWPIGFDIPHKIDMGAAYYVTVSPTDNDGETKDLTEKFTVLVRNDRFAIIDLTKKK